MFPVDHGDVQQQQQQDRRPQAIQGPAEAHDPRQGTARTGQLHQRIAHGDGLPAVSATSPQQQPAEYRHIVVPGDDRAAVRAGRARRDNAQVPGQAMDEHVAEAAEECAQARDEGQHQPGWVAGDEFVHGRSSGMGPMKALPWISRSRIFRSGWAIIPAAGSRIWRIVRTTALHTLFVPARSLDPTTGIRPGSTCRPALAGPRLNMDPTASAPTRATTST